MERPTQSAEEIEELSSLGVSELNEAVRDRGGVLALETLAYLVRHAQNDGPAGTELLEAALRQLTPRTRVIAKASAAGWIADDDWEDIGQEALIVMIRGLAQADAGELSPWEINFWNTFKLDCIDALRALRRKAARLMLSVDDPSRGPDSLELKEALDHHPLDQLTKREILSILSPEEAQAFSLVHFERVRVKGGDGTVMGLMGKSREMIYKYLRSAIGKIRADPRFKSWTGRE